MTLSEVLLWKEIKNKNILGFDFDRQRPIGNFIVDFYCKELSLAVEIDGDTHIYKYDYDEERQRELEKLGVHFLRFEDIEVKKNMSNVLRVIENWIENHQPTPDPIAVNLRVELLIRRLEKVSPPFEGGVAGAIDYLIFTKSIPPAGVVDLFLSLPLYL